MNYGRSDKSSSAALCTASVNYLLIKARSYTSFLHFYTLAKTRGSRALTDERRGEIITALRQREDKREENHL